METYFAIAEGDVEEQDLEAARVHGVFGTNGNLDRFVEHVIRRRITQPSSKTAAKFTWVYFLYIHGMSEAIGSVLRPLGTGVAHRVSPWKWIVCNGWKYFIQERLRKGVIYKVTCMECDTLYISKHEMLRNLEECLSEHNRHVEK